jgi:photosystem II stability/assembly factor-like uncharacterized protein
MPVKKKHTPIVDSWIHLGGPQTGTITALVVAPGDEVCVFIGTKVGLYRSTGFTGDAIKAWEKLADAPIGIMSLAASPDFTEDHLLIAGTDSGISLSRDAGRTWHPAKLPMQRSMVLSICFSPDFARDGIIMAGTLEDGVIYSDTQGESWILKSFGMLDATVFSLVLSPAFAEDETIFAGCDSSLYLSYNQGRAWKGLNFPEGTAPILSLAISPQFQVDGILFAGTDANGLFRSTDQGETWQKMALEANSINALFFSLGHGLFAATESGIFRYGGKRPVWKKLLDLPNAISFAQQGGLAFAGSVEDGIWLTPDLVKWSPVNLPPIRTIIGLVLSPQFDKDRTAFMYGPQEGVWRTVDSGSTWEGLNEELPGLDVHSLVVSPNYDHTGMVLITSADGVFVTRDGGQRWILVSPQPAGLASLSPNGHIAAIAFPAEGIKMTEDWGQTWTDVAGPWVMGGKVTALAVADQAHLFVALQEGVDGDVAIWQGKPGHLEKVLSVSAPMNPVVSFWIPTEAAADRPWYASLGNRVWKFSARAGRPVIESIVFKDTDQPESIFALRGILESNSQLIFACTSKHIYRSINEKTWRVAADFGAEQALDLALPASFIKNKLVYALLLGGTMVRGLIQ